MKTLPRGAAAAAAVAMGLSLAALPAMAEEITPPEGSTPVVGMAVEPGSKDLWLAGPDADRGTFVNAKNGDEWTFSGKPESVQALAWSDGRLWVGDIGDTSLARDHVVIFRLGAPENGKSTYFAYDFEYPDGPHDAKAMLLSGRGNIYIVTSGEDPGIYRAPADPSRQNMNDLRRVADAPKGVTDGVFLTDGTTMALRTETGIEYIDALEWAPLVTDTLVGAPQDESITVGQRDELFVGGNPGIRSAEVPSSDTTTTVTPEPTASPTPTATGEATPVASASPDTGSEQGGTPSQPARTSTIVAIALAGLLAVAAGAVTFFVRR